MTPPSHGPVDDPVDIPRKYLTILQAADLLAVSTRTVRRLIERGDLPAYRIGDRSIRVKLSDTVALLKPAGGGAHHEV